MAFPQFKRIADESGLLVTACNFREIQDCHDGLTRFADKTCTVRVVSFI